MHAEYGILSWVSDVWMPRVRGSRPKAFSPGRLPRFSEFLALIHVATHPLEQGEGVKIRFFQR